MDTHDQLTVPVALFNNRDRQDGQLPSDLQDRILKSTAAWVKRENSGANRDNELRHGDLVPPGYLDFECPRCRELPDVAILSNGNKTRETIGNNDQIHRCSHAICSTCHFVPEQLKQMPCIFQRTTTVSILDASQPGMYLSNEPFSPRNARLLQRHVTPDFFRGKNPVPSLWRDLRVVVEQRKAYLHRDGDPRRRVEFEAQRLEDGLDPKICRQHIIDFRAMHVIGNLQQRLKEREEAIWQTIVTSYVGHLPRVSPQELEDTDCYICLSQYNGRTTETGPIEEPVRLPCSHIFGSSCLWQWLMKSTTCPTCRRILLPARDILEFD